ncbi:MAG TPA: gamma-glutamyltransferase [Jiangellaceae bacterium]|nr:gamma-glutamyltransferase [Jiangellaceae bacterium]
MANSPLRNRVLALLPACALVLAFTQAPAQADGRAPDKQPTATGHGGAVASLDPYAAQAGLDVLEGGGNAVDAAVAASAMLGLTRPYDGSIGGGGFMQIYSAETGEVTTIDSRERAGSDVQPDHFLDPETGEVLPFEERRVSGLSIGVPGLVRGWERALEVYGTMPMHRVLTPAINTGLRGFVVDEQYHSRTESNLERLRDFTSSRETFLVDGEAPEVGTIFRNPELAQTYRLLAREGADAFYEGELAEAIADTVTDPPVVPETDRTVRPGEMTVDDLTDYTAEEREPTMVDYRGYEVYGMGPPSSGGSTVGEALNILSNVDLGALPHEQALHQVIESSALAFADRNAYLGDGEYVDVPLNGLLSQEFADERAALIDDEAALKPVDEGDPWPYDDGDGNGSAGDPGTTGTDGSTTHLTVADDEGNVVSFTFTIESISGSGIAVPGAGFLLNNELTDFSAEPDHPANAPAGGKSPRSSMSPTIVLEDGEPISAFGSPGGARIITTVLQVAVNQLDFDMSLPEAIAAPRLSNTNSSGTLAEPGIPADVLAERGHDIDETGTLGNVTGVAFLPDGRMQAAAEAERLGGGSALVVDPTD